jgi:hypothetical protein
MGVNSIPESQVAGAVGANPEDFEVPPHRPAGMRAFERRNAVTEMLDQERKKSAKVVHMWDESRRAELRSGNDLVIPQDKRERSGFDGRLPYKGVMIGGAVVYAVQNRKIFKGKKHQISLSQVPEKIEIPEKRYPKGEVLPAGTVYARAEVALMLATGDEEILEQEPLRCKVCIDFLGRSDLDLLSHMMKKHPKESAEIADGMEKIRAEEDAAKERDLPPEAPQPPKPRRQSFRGAGAA